MDNVNFIIYPVQYSRKAYADQWSGQIKMSSTKGRVVDHIALSVNDVSATLSRLRAEGVKILGHDFIEGPDYIRIEIVATDDRD